MVSIEEILRLASLVIGFSLLVDEWKDLSAGILPQHDFHR
jgi:hypothetical protein